MPKKRTTRKADTPAQQHARFVEAAKKAEADESPGALDRAIKRIDPSKTPAQKVTAKDRNGR